MPPKPTLDRRSSCTEVDTPDITRFDLDEGGLVRAYFFGPGSLLYVAEYRVDGPFHCVAGPQHVPVRCRTFIRVAFPESSAACPADAGAD